MLRHIKFDSDHIFRKKVTLLTTHPCTGPLCTGVRSSVVEMEMRHSGDLGFPLNSSYVRSIAPTRGWPTLRTPPRHSGGRETCHATLQCNSPPLFAVPHTIVSTFTSMPCCCICASFSKRRKGPTGRCLRSKLSVAMLGHATLEWLTLSLVAWSGSVAARAVTQENLPRDYMRAVQSPNIW